MSRLLELQNRLNYRFKLAEEAIEKSVADLMGFEEEYIPSATNGDYSPNNPWDAPGMNIRDFI